MLKKTLPYKIIPNKLLVMLAMGGASLLSGCEKDPKIIFQHDTVYRWGSEDASNIRPTDKIKASADSVEVRYVILESDGTEFGGLSPTTIRTKLLEEPFAVSPKVRGRGALDNMQMTKPEHKRDSIWLVERGFTFGPIYVFNKTKQR